MDSRFLYSISRLILLGLFQSSWGTFCDPYINYTDTLDARILQFYKGIHSYHIKVEMNMVNEKETISLEENFDGDSQKAMVSMYRQGSSNRFIFNMDSKQYFIIIDEEECFAMEKIPGDSVAKHLMEWLPGHADTSINNFFASKLKYIGQDTRRGVPVDRWQSCQYSAIYNSNYTIDYYFARASWTGLDYDNQPAPISSEVKGVFFDNKGKEHKFEEYFEFFSFKTIFEGDSKLYEIPTQVVCHGEVNTQELPKLPPRYSYRLEQTEGEFKSMIYTDIWYDSEYKLMRTDVRNHEDENAQTVIHDLNFGVSYTINKQYGNCSVTTLPRSSIEIMNIPSPVLNDTGSISRIRNPLELFYLDGNKTYAYRGMTNVRGAPVRVFVARRNDYIIDVLPDLRFNATFVVYFLNETWVEIDNTGSKKISKSVPIQMEITVEAPSDGKPFLSSVYSFYDFNFDQESFDVFNIEPCFPEDRKEHIEITFVEKVDKMVLEKKEAFLSETRGSIVLLANIYPLRVQNMEFNYGKTEYNVDMIYVTATLLPKPPASAQFRKYIKYGNVGTDGNIGNLTNSDECADACTEMQGCQSYDFCPNKVDSTCFLSRRHDGAQSIVQYESCTSGTRPINIDLDYKESDLESALFMLKDITFAGGLVFDLKLTDTFTRRFVASEINTDIVRKEGASTGVLDIEKFDRRSGNILISTKQKAVLLDVSTDGCATACLNQRSFFCQAFTSCPRIKRCLLSADHPDLVPFNRTLINPTCDLFARDFVGRFEKSPGKTVVMKGEWVIKTDVDSEQECAKQCLTHDGFQCKSFDFCTFGRTTKCLLGDKHIYDVPSDDIHTVAVCDHYSRFYLDDFKYQYKKKINLTEGIVFKYVNLQQCAKLCVDRLNYSCSGFSFVEEDDACYFEVPELKGSPNMVGFGMREVAFYKRIYLPDATTYTPKRQTSGQVSISYGYSPGVIAGVAIAMLLIGILAGIVGFNVYLSSRKRTSPARQPATVSFENRNYADTISE